MSALQVGNSCESDDAVVAEIVVASEDGSHLAYGDSKKEVVGFVDISDPVNPVGAGEIQCGGEPTAVAFAGDYVLAVINTSPDFVNPSGVLKVFDESSLQTQMPIAEIDLGGQPDAIAISPDKQYAAIAIENERDEDLGDGEIPQMPAGHLVVISMSGPPSSWVVNHVSMSGLAGVYEPSDPEPEGVAINRNNVAVVTMQENNALVMVDLASATVIGSVSAGTVDLDMIDTNGDDDLVMQTDSLTGVPREPDGATWISDEYFVTADEGDMRGGSRGFTVFSAGGTPVYGPGSDMEHLMARIGHYNEGRSGKKGNEPENVFYGQFGNEKLLFVNSERSSVTVVYDVKDPMHPKYKQVLPAGVGPEGGVAIPHRNLAATASEEDARDDKMRSVINIYKYHKTPQPQYPTLVSADRANGTPIPWAAMSGLACGGDASQLWAIEDSAFKKSRFFAIDASTYPAKLTHEVRIMDSNDVLKNAVQAAQAATSFAWEDWTVFNEDKTVNIDPEGITVADDGSLYIASEGRGTVGDDSRPMQTLDVIVNVDAHTGVIQKAITLPNEINEKQVRFGFEGVAFSEGKLVVAFQRKWGGDDHPRLGIYDLTAETWEFVFYPLDAVESPYGGWVGLSDIAPLGGMKFAVLERDNQGGPDARVKRVYSIDLTSYTPNSAISKTFVKDVVPDLKKAGGLVFEKVEGLTYCKNDGSVWLHNDNDGVDDNSGETQLMKLDMPMMGRRRHRRSRK